jgi:hypothetical protein
MTMRRGWLVIVALVLAFIARPALAQGKPAFEIKLDGTYMGHAQTVTGLSTGKAGQVTIAMADPQGMSSLLAWYNKSNVRRAAADRRTLAITTADKTWVLTGAAPRALMNRPVAGVAGIVMVIAYDSLTVH